MYAPTVLLLSAALSIVTTLTANEGCRYIDNDDALRITDMAVNLAIKYRWADWLKTKLPYLKLGQPEFVLRYLIKDCGNLLDLQGAIDESVRKSIEKIGETIIGKITRMDIIRYLPDSLDELSSGMKVVLDYNPRGATDKFGELDTIMKEKVEKLNTIRNKATDKKDLFYSIKYYCEVTIQFVSLWMDFINEHSNFGQRAEDAFSGLDSMKEKYELVKKAMEVMNNVKSFLDNDGVRTVVESSIPEIENDNQIISEAFSKDIIPCHRLQKITNAAIDALCRDQGILTALGAYFFFLGVVMFHLIFTILLTRIYFSAHGFLHLWLLL